MAEKVLPGATTVIGLQENGSKPGPVIMVCCPGAIPILGVLIPQQVPVYPTQLLKVEVSKSAFGHP